MTAPLPYADWQAVADAARSPFFRGRAADTARDRAAGGPLMPSSEALFTQSNARVLIGHAANGALRLAALPTRVYPAPTGEGAYGLGPGMYHHFDVAMHVGGLSYHVALDDAPDGASIDLTGDPDCETFYADAFLPVTRARAGALEATLVSCAPVAPDAATAALAPAPLPGPPGALHVLRLRNAGSAAARGTLTLRADDLLIGHYEDASPELRGLNRPAVSLRQQTLILARPEGAAGIHLYGGRWARLVAPCECVAPFHLEPGEEAVFEAHIGLGAAPGDVMPALYALRLLPALEWVNRTAAFWRERLGRLEVDAAGVPGGSEWAAFSRDLHLRGLLDNFNCLQTDAAGELVAHWQGAPSHGYGTVWGIDVEPTAVSVAHLCPELALAVARFFSARSRVPRGPRDHSLPILVAPVIIARQWLQITGDAAELRRQAGLLSDLRGIMDEVLSMRAPAEALFPSRYSSDGPVGRRYDYGANVKACHAFDAMAYLLRGLGLADEALPYSRAARDIREAIARTMVVDGPFGPQISGGTNLGEPPGGFYLPEAALYYDGEDTSSMLAPAYGACDYDWEPWVNYHRFARSLWCPNYDPEFDALRWSPGEGGVFDGTAFFSRLGGSVTPDEMREALETLRRVAVDDATGSVFWWPHGLEHKRALTRCSQGQGAWAWQYLVQWLGLQADACARQLTLAPRGLLTRVDWRGFRAGPHRFDVAWAEDEHGATARLRNGNDAAWTAQVGFRRPGAGAAGGLAWQTRRLEPGEEAVFRHDFTGPASRPSMGRAGVLAREAGAFGDGGVLFRRFGPALLWGHWDPDQLWNLAAMPLALRFVVGNATPHDWTGAAVELVCPEGWTAQARAPLHWIRPDAMAPGTVRLELGPLPAMSRTAAPFWIAGPAAHRLQPGWAEPGQSFHELSQPGDGLTVAGAARQEAVFVAELRATAADGSAVARRLRVPVVMRPG
jgi:hypothetical protein